MTTWPTWSLQLSEINNIMYADFSLYTCVLATNQIKILPQATDRHTWYFSRVTRKRQKWNLHCWLLTIKTKHKTPVTDTNVNPVTIQYPSSYLLQTTYFSKLFECRPLKSLSPTNLHMSNFIISTFLPNLSHHSDQGSKWGKEIPLWPFPFPSPFRPFLSLPLPLPSPPLPCRPLPLEVGPLKSS